MRHAEAARLLEAEGVSAESVGLHLLHSEPAADPHTVQTLRNAATGASTRGAPQAAAAFLRRALAEPPAGPALADVQLELGLAQAGSLQPDGYHHLSAAVAAATSPAQRSAVALRGGRALGLLGEFEQAFVLCRQGLDDAAGAPPELRARLEAELVTDGLLQVSTLDAVHLIPSAGRERALGLWRVNAAMAGSFAGEPASRTVETLSPVLATGALSHEPESLLRTAATHTLILSDEFDAARTLYEEVIATAAPRGWLIALAHGCMLRALARLRRGWALDAEADAGLAFESKLGLVQPAAILWTLTFLVDALVELDEPDRAEAALAAAGQTGEPPAGVVGAMLLLQARARLRLAQHRADQARADAFAAGTRARQLRISHPVFAGWRTEAVAALVALGDRDAARALASEQLALAERLATPSACGSALRTVAAVAVDSERRWRTSNVRSPCWRRRRPGWSTPVPWSSWAPRCAGRTVARTLARRCGRRSTRPGAVG